MHPEDAEELLARVTTEKLDSAEIRLAQLELERQSLLTIIRKLIGSAESRAIDIADAADHDVSLPKSEQNRIAHEILDILEEIRLEHGASAEQIASAEQSVTNMKVRIQSIEAMMPGATH